MPAYRNTALLFSLDSLILPAVDRFLQELRHSWGLCSPAICLFPGADRRLPLSITAAQRAYEKARVTAGITHGAGIHTLRHSFATHLLDAGVDLLTIKQWMGHSSLGTTTAYLHVSTNRRAAVRSPLDTLNLSVHL